MNASQEALQERFERDPSDAVAFETLEEGHFVAGEWDALVVLYQRRLEAPDLDPGSAAAPRARLVFRLAQVLEERLDRPDHALARYEEAGRLDPTLRAAFSQARRIHGRREQWEMVLQLAEHEGTLPMRPYELAAFHTEMGRIWLDRMDDAAQADALFSRALEADGGHVPALLGKAEAQEAQGHADAAIAALEHAVDQVRGAERAPLWAHLARLERAAGADAERVTEHYRRALGDDPRHAEALEAIASHAEAAEQWELHAELQERRFDLSDNMLDRLAIAHDTGRIQLERLRNPQGARLWFQRAEEIFPDDPVVHLYLADVERLSGNHEALARHLRRAAELADDAAPIDVLRESAQLASEQGDEAYAIDQLRRVTSREATSQGVFEELSELLERTDRNEELVALIEEHLGQVAEGSDEQARLWVRLGRVHETRTGETDAAVAAYVAATGIRPAEADAVDALERLYRKAERFDELRGLLERATREGGEEPARTVAWACTLGELCFDRFDDAGAAQAHFEAALDIDPEDPRARQGLERIALATGDDDVILASFEREAEVTSDRARLAFLVGELARIHEGRDDAARALHWVARLHATVPEERATLEHMVRLQATLGLDRELSESLEHLDPMLEADERGANRRRLGSLYSGLDELDRALDAYHRALAVDPDDLEAARAVDALLEPTSRIADRVEIKRQLAGLLEGAERAAVLFDAGGLLCDELDDAVSACNLFEEALATGEAPDGTEDRVLALLERLGRWDELCDHLDAQRRRLDPLDPRAFEIELRRAEILLDHMDSPQEAADLFALAREGAPDSQRATRGLERALRRLGDDERLVALLEEIARREEDAAARSLVELERATLLEERLQQLPLARTVLTELADAVSPAAADAEARLRSLLQREGDWPALYERIASGLGAGDDAALHRELAALCRDRLRDPARAAEHFEAALESEPGDVACLQAVAALHRELDRPEDLVRTLERELETIPDETRARAIHGEAAIVHERLGNADGAETHHRKLLDLDPGATESVAFLSERLEADARYGELVDLLQERLDHASGDPSTETSLRLHIAAIQAGPLGNRSAAISTLEPAAARDDAIAVVAEPLADWLQREGREQELVELARRAAAAAELPSERGGWQMRIGDALVRSGDDEAAAGAFRQALADRPDDRDIENALRQVLRRLGDAPALAFLLEAELGRVGGIAEIPLRLELAELCASRLDRCDDALVHLRRVLDIDPREADARERAIALAARTDAKADEAALLAGAAERTRRPRDRAVQLTRRGELLAALDRDADAADAFEAALAAEPHFLPAIEGLRGLCERGDDAAAVLHCIERQWAAAASESPAERTTRVREAAEFAQERLGSEAALPWWERLQRLAPEDAAVRAQITAAHRDAGRTRETLAAIEAELALAPGAERRVALALESADLLASRCDSPGRAAEALEEARRSDPDAAPLLVALDALYEALGRDDRRREIVEARIAGADGAESLALHRTAAALCHGTGDGPARAGHLWCALALAEGSERIDLLRELADEMRRAGRADLWTRLAEAELAALDPDAPVFAERRQSVALSLARTYMDELGAWDAALPHLRRLTEDALSPDRQRETEARLLTLLRRAGDAVELEQRLAVRLDRETGASADEWLELARLRHERLHRPAAALAAYQETLARRDDDLAALRGLRAAADVLGRADLVAETLERELELSPDAPATERGRLLRRLGQVAWRTLDETPRASRAFAAALEANPQDLLALRSLQTLLETVEDWRGACDLYESEVGVLGEGADERRQEVWLRAGELARDALDDPERALRAYDAAAAISPLPLPRQLEWADLLAATGDEVRFVDVHSTWLDADHSPAQAPDHLRLAETLEGLGRLREARDRASRAADLDTRDPRAWDHLARLCEKLEDPDAAATALERAAECRQGHAAATRRLRAAQLLDTGQDERRAILLADAVADDPALAEAHAQACLVSARLGRLADAETFAQRALTCAHTPALPEALQLETALAGARAAESMDHLESASRLLETALEVAPDHAEALAAMGRALSRLGDGEGARRVLTRCLAQDLPDVDRALHLTLLAEAEEAAGRSDEALDHFREALALDGERDEAHAGLTRSLVRANHGAEAIDALRAWAEHAATPEDRAARLLQAAELELGKPRGEGEAAAEGLLEEAVHAAPGTLNGWVLLCQLLWSQGRVAELVDATGRALEQEMDGATRARLCLLRGRALEQRGDARDAADAFGAACRADPRCAEGALSSARLLRGLGEWRAAADVLDSFVSQVPDDAARLTAPAQHQLGRLLAGPLEDVEGAIRVYRDALDSDPQLAEAREALADLLVHRDACWDEAVARHRELLDQNPTRLASLRGLLRIARGRKKAGPVASGLAILRALGVATPDERIEAPARPAAANAARPALADPLAEGVRRMALEVADEIAEAFGVGSPDGASGVAADPTARFRARITAAEGRLAAPALVPLPTDDVAEALTLVARFANEAEELSGDGNLVNALSRSLTRRARKRVRKALGGCTAEDVAAMDFAAWRSELRALATACALDEEDVELRTAFMAWFAADDPNAGHAIQPESDIRDRINASPEAKALLRQVVRTWLDAL